MASTATLWVSVIAVLVAFVTLLIVIKQLGLMERQDEIIARRAKLVVIVECDASQREIVFSAENTGKRGIDSFDWHIWVPDALGSGLTVNRVYQSNTLTDSIEQINGRDHHHFSGCFRDYLYPTRSKIFAKLMPPRNSSIDGTYTFYAQIACEDGVFPEKIDDGHTTSTIHILAATS